MQTRLLSALAAILLSRVALGQEGVPPAPAPTPAPTALAPSEAALEPEGAPSPAPPLASAAVGTEGAPPAAETEGASPAVDSEGAPPAEAQALRGPLLLEVEGFATPADVETVRAALSAEFGCLVLLDASASRFAPVGRIVVALHADTKELAVTYVDALEQSSTRVVQEPSDVAERTRTITLLAGTLARPPVEEDGGPAATVITKGPPPPPSPPPTHTAVASFFYPLASNFDVPDVHTYFAFSLLYGRIGSLDGLGLGTLQFASRGVQGAQLAFLGNGAGGQVAGLQAAFGVNSAGSLSGLQLALVNHTTDAMSGAQGGLLNHAGGDVTGLQAGFTVNLARDVRGGQVGIVNVAQHVRGLQVGLINVADEVDGVPIGLISVSKEGGVHPVTWFSSVTHFNAGLKFATRYTYTFMNASWDPELAMIGPGFGIGGSVPLFLDNLFADIDLSETYLFKDTGPADDGRSLTRLRGTIRYQILPHLSVFAGGGYTGKIERAAEASGTDLGDFYYASLGEFVAGIGL